MSTRSSQVGQGIVSAIGIVGGTKLMVTGRGGYRAAFSEGTHIKIGGAILLVLGLWLAIDVIRSMKKKDKRP